MQLLVQLSRARKCTKDINDANRFLQQRQYDLALRSVTTALEVYSVRVARTHVLLQTAPESTSLLMLRARCHEARNDHQGVLADTR